MRALSNDEIFDYSVGSTYYELAEGGIELFRFNKTDAAFWKDLDNKLCSDGSYTRFLCPAGIKISLITDAAKLSLRCHVTERQARDFASIDIWVDGKFLYAPSLEGEIITGEFALPGTGEKRVDIYLPQCRPTVIENISLSEGATAKAAPKRKRLLAIGDSITQGMTAENPSLSYANVLAREFDMDLSNLGVGGWKFIPESIVEPMTPTPDLITLAYGTNDFSASFPFEQMEKYLEKLVSFYPQTPIFVFAPLYRIAIENNQNAAGDTIQTYRDKIKKAVEGYTNMHFISHEGLVPETQTLFADNLHPNNGGMIIYGTQAAAAIRASGVKF